MAGTADSPIGHGIVRILLADSTPQNAQARERVRTILRELQSGHLDRSQFTADCNLYFNSEALHDYSATLADLGEPQIVTLNTQRPRGGMIFRSWTVQYNDKQFQVTEYEQSDGKLEQFLVLPAAQ
jgi:hypothetical protein